MVNKEIETQEIDEKTVVQDVQILESCNEKTVISEEDSSTQIVNELPEKNTEKKAKKKKNPIVSFFKGIFIFLLTIILIIVIWCGYSALNRKKSLSLLPTDYSVYLKTDSVWKALRPIIDLQAADIILSSSELAQIRGALMSFRQSSLKDSKIVEFLGSRPVDIGLYLEEGKSDFVGILDLGFL